MEYKYTGAQVPVDANDMFRRVDDELCNFDIQGDTYGYCPYTEPIIYTTANGKTIQVPLEIQNQVIAQHKRVDTDESNESDSWTKTIIIIGIIIILCLLGHMYSRN
jgi:hypothetical protein